MNKFHQNTLVLECVSFGFHVELVISTNTQPLRHFHLQMLVDFASVPVFAQHSAQNSHSAHPKNSGRHACVGCSLTFADSTVSAFALCLHVCTSAGSRVDSNGFANNQTILHQFPHGQTYSSRKKHSQTSGCLGNVAGFVGVEPDLTLSTSKNTGGKPLLQT